MGKSVLCSASPSFSGICLFTRASRAARRLGRKLREGLLNEPFLALPHRHTEQTAQPLRSGRLDTPRPQVIVCGKLKGFGFRVEGANSLAQPSDQNGFVPGTKWAEAEVLANLGALVALGALAPLTIEVRFGWHTNLAGQMRDHTAGHICASIGKSPVELEAFNSTAKPRRVTPVLLLRSSSSSGLSVQH